MSLNATHLQVILGKTIRAVVIRFGENNPKDQIFLVFDDGTAYEFYGSDINSASGLDSGGKEAALKYVTMFGGEIKIVE
jgi:hypothetical protein